MYNRRNFLKRTSVAAAAASFVPYVFTSARSVRAQAASDRLQIGYVGLGGMGRGDANDFTRLGDVVAIADVDSEYGLARTLGDQNIGKKVNGQKIGQPDAYKDYRRILERKDIDIVGISTTDAWHVKIAIEALQAGKHVFCQKPLTLTLEEGQLIRNACKKFPNLVFQVGTQQRSQKDQFARACLMIRKGMLGDIKKITADIGEGDVGGPFQKVAPPESLDWDFWLGQCPKTDYMRARAHGTFRWFYEYSGGKFTDWGAHHIDFAHWALGEDKEGCGPISFKPIIAEHPVAFENGYPTVDDRYNTSNRFDIQCTFASGVEMNVCSHSENGNGILIEGTKGRMHVNRERIKGKPIEDRLFEQLTEDDYKELCNGKSFDGWHKMSFIRCIKDGGLPISDVYSHVQAMQSCHLCAIAARLNREIKWDPKAEKILGDEQADAFFAREQRSGFEIPRV